MNSSTLPAPLLSARRAARRRATWAPPLALLALLLGALWLARAILTPPAVVPAGASANTFSAERAMAHLSVIAAEPRPLGSAASLATRDYLIAELEVLGLEPEIQTSVGIIRFPGAEHFSAAPVQNIAVRLPGRDSTGAILLDAHYDGGATGPAAGDCGACVVTLLETLRALRASAPLRNDLIVVFTDGEERGDLGAEAFAAEHPWVDEVALAINYESQGSGGPVTPYIMSAQSGAWVSEFLDATPHPVAHSALPAFVSLFADSRLGCDLEEYMARGIPGIGLVFVGDPPAYHTLRDNIEVLHARTVQHEGQTTLAAVRRFGEADLSAVEDAPNRIFFTLWPGTVLSYSESAALPLGTALTALLGGVMLLGVRRGRMTVGGALRGLGWFLVAYVGSLVLVVALWALLKQLTPALRVTMVGNYAADLYLVALSLVATAAIAALYAWRSRHEAANDLAAGALLGWALLAWLTTLALPGASYLFAVPLLFATVAFGWLMARRAPGPWARTALLALTGLPTLVLIFPFVALFAALMWRFDGLTGLPFGAVALLWLLPLVPLLAPWLAWLPRRARAWLPPASLMLGLLLLSAATARAGFSAERPRPDQLAYELDHDAGAARWLSADVALDEWTEPFFPTAERAVAESAPFTMAPAFVAPAPAVALPPPELTLFEEVIEGEARALRLIVASPLVGAAVQVEVAAKGEILAATLGGQPFDLSAFQADGRRSLRLVAYGIPAEGLELTLRVASHESVIVTLRQWSDGLPDGVGAAPRPATTMPAPGPFRDPTVVIRRFIY